MDLYSCLQIAIDDGMLVQVINRQDDLAGVETRSFVAEPSPSTGERRAKKETKEMGLPST